MKLAYPSLGDAPDSLTYSFRARYVGLWLSYETQEVCIFGILMDF